MKHNLSFLYFISYKDVIVKFHKLFYRFFKKINFNNLNNY